MFLGSREGFRLETLGILVALGGLLVWGGLLSFSSNTGVGWNDPSSNFHNWLATGDGQIVLDILLVVCAWILFVSVASIIIKWRLPG